MTGPEARAGSAAAGAQGSADGQPAIDWKAAAESPEFRELVAKRKRFVLPATIFFLGWFIVFILLCGYAPDFMGEQFLADGLTVGYVLALSQFVMVWVLCWLYLRISDRVFDPLARKAAERALEAGRATAASKPDTGPEGPAGGEVAPR
jgi:uncharacterized membrane protein (DUF485 family)